MPCGCNIYDDIFSALAEVILVMEEKRKTGISFSTYVEVNLKFYMTKNLLTYMMRQNIR